MSDRRWISMEGAQVVRVSAKDDSWVLDDIVEAFEALIDWHHAEEELASREQNPVPGHEPTQEELDFLDDRRDAERQNLYTVIHTLIYSEETRSARYDQDRFPREGEESGWKFGSP